MDEQVSRQGFFAFWKDADLDIPILVEARRESVASKP